MIARAGYVEVEKNIKQYQIQLVPEIEEEREILRALIATYPFGLLNAGPTLAPVLIDFNLHKNIQVMKDED